MMVTESGEVFGLGDNEFGELGMGSHRKILTPTLHKRLTRLGVRGLVCGGSHSLAFVQDGSLLSWGYNSTGPLGTGNTDTFREPVKILQPKDSEIFGGISEICAGNTNSMALMKNGTILFWGENRINQRILAPTLLVLQPKEGAGTDQEREGRPRRENRGWFSLVGVLKGYPDTTTLFTPSP
jgi:alpha-tubulin suppressor-like RCC1 family protein